MTVGANFEYFLFRPEPGEAQVNSGLGQVGFSLTNAQAYFKKNDSVTPVAVSGGDLVINFNSNAFKTTLDLYHMQLGRLSLIQPAVSMMEAIFIQEMDPRVS